MVGADEPLRHGLGNAATGGIWRVRGTAGSAILKVARLPGRPRSGPGLPTSDEPDHWNYWRREALAYETGLAAAAYAGAAIPRPRARAVHPRRRRHRAVASRRRGTARLGLAGPAAGPLRLRTRRRAGALGRRVPGLPWLSRRWLAQYLAEGPPASPASPTTTGTTRRGRLAGPRPAALRRLWADHGRLTAIADAAERTLCHLDVWPANLIDRTARRCCSTGRSPGRARSARTSRT